LATTLQEVGRLSLVRFPIYIQGAYNKLSTDELTRDELSFVK